MDPSPVPPLIPQARDLLGERQLAEELVHDESSSNPDDQDELHIECSSSWGRPVDLVSLATTAQPRPWHQDQAAVHRNFIRQILGLNPFRTSYLRLYAPLKDAQSRAILFAGILSAIAAGVPLPLIGVVLGRIINNFPPPQADLQARLFQLMGIAVVYFAVTWAWSVCWAVTGERVSRKTREALLERTLGLDMAFFDTKAPDMTNILTEKTQTIQLGTSEKVGLFIASISYFVSAFVVGFVLNPQLTGVLFITVIPAMACIVIYGTKTVSKLAKEASSWTEKAASVAESSIRAIQVVQAFGLNEKLASEHKRLLQLALRTGIKKSFAGALMLGSVWCVAYSANALAFWYGNYLRFSGTESSGEAGTIYAVVFLILDASFVVGQFGPFIQTFALAAAAGQSVFSILDERQPDIDVYSEEGKVVDSSRFNDSLTLQDVTFVYPARPTVRVLDNVSLRFRPGEMTGIVGSSGSGKSTIIALLLRFYDPSSGKVLVGPDDLRNLNVRSLRSHIALVTQSPVLFSGTILDNIRHGIPPEEEVSDEEVLDRCYAAAAEAHCDFLEHLPDGIYTAIGSGHHSQLSGGQKQRITLARALVGRPALLLLDEFTSAMDATSEAVVLENLKRSSKYSNRTTIIVAHRLATIKSADRIIVMRDGAVVQEGSHDWLIGSTGVYSELFRAQQFDKRHLSPAGSSLTLNTHSTSAERRVKRSDDDPIDESTPLLSNEGSEMGALQLVRRCLGLSRREAPAIGLGLFFSAVSGAIIIGEAVIFGNLVELLNDDTNSAYLQSQVSFFCILFFVLSIIALTSHTLGGSAFGYVSEHLVVRTQDISLRTILNQDIGWFLRPGHSQHVLMARLNMDSGHIKGLSGVILGTFFSITTSVVGGIILAHITAWKIAIVLLCSMPIMLVAGFLRLRILAMAEERHQSAYNDAAAIASEACAAIRVVAALGRERDILRMYRAAVQKPYEESLRFSLGGNVLLAFSLSITYFVYALAYWWGSKQVRNGNYTQRDFFTVLPALLFSAQAAGQLFSLAPEITRAKTAGKSVFALHDECPSIIADTVHVSRSSRSIGPTYGTFSHDRPAVTHGRIEFKSVSLHYESRPGVYALDDVSFTIEAGEKVAFVGRSGGGKTSCVNLIERFYDPTYGEVLLDGRDVRKENVQEFRAKLGLVEQEPDLFPGSLTFNIGLGAEPGMDVSQEDVETVAKQCGLHDFIMSLPQGYNTDVGTHGSKLSGGQRQRIAIARALIRNPKVLLLDEATSQLDATTEREIRDVIAAASSGRTTIMIAHRLASVQYADRIFVFEKGNVVEVGSHAELVALGGIYSSMVAAQELD